MYDFIFPSRSHYAGHYTVVSGCQPSKRKKTLMGNARGNKKVREVVGDVWRKLCFYTCGENKT